MASITSKTKPEQGLKKRIWKRWDLYLMLSLPILWYVIFMYVPMYGVQIAFKRYNPALGILGSPWVGLENFRRFFNSHQFTRLLWNTFRISFFSILIGFPVPIALAVLIHEIKNNKLKKLVQNITYMPNFISLVVLVGMLSLFFDSNSGFVNNILASFGFDRIPFMERPKWFLPLFIGSNIWAGMGFQSIIYVASLAGVDPQLYEAAKIDGATRWQRITKISLPSIMPTIVTLLILEVGNIMAVGFEKILLMQNSLNIPASDVIETFVYRSGVLGGNYSYSAAIGLFNALINFTLLVLVNWFARKKGETSLW